MNQKIETTIIDLLKAQEPATLGQICWELRTQQGLRTTEVLPIAITAISAMQEKGLICEYEQMPFNDPMEYAWVLAEEQPKQKYLLVDGQEVLEEVWLTPEEYEEAQAKAKEATAGNLHYCLSN
jgi:hypothetical protein